MMIDQQPIPWEAVEVMPVSGDIVDKGLTSHDTEGKTTKTIVEGYNDNGDRRAAKQIVVFDHPVHGIFKLRDYQENLWDPVYEFLQEEWYCEDKVVSKARAAGHERHTEHAQDQYDSYQQNQYDSDQQIAHKLKQLW
jgi:hypothetical protein